MEDFGWVCMVRREKLVNTIFLDERVVGSRPDNFLHNIVTRDEDNGFLVNR